MGFSGGSDGKEYCLQYRRPGFNPWVGKIPWRKKQLPTPIFLSGECPRTEEPDRATVHGIAKSQTRLNNQALYQGLPVCVCVCAHLAFICVCTYIELSGASQVALVVKHPPASRTCKRQVFDPWFRKIPWNRARQPMLYSCLENPMNRGAWQATIHRLSKSWT